VDITEIEDAFVAAARGYGERKGISYQVWREAGVSAEVLKKAGIGRGAG
jgi:DNA-binding phage protein